MAKLNGIQVIDMVGGEVSKIAYNGEEYAKVAEQDGEIYPKAGDIALRKSDSSFIDKGGYYEVDSLPDGVNPRLVGHSGGYFERENFDFFGKATPAPATDDKLAELESRIAALEAARPSAQQAPATPQYRKVTGRSPQVGDYVKYNTTSYRFLTEGKYYEVTEVEGETMLSHIDDEGDNTTAYLKTEDVEVCEKVDKQVQPTQDDAQPLKVGDYAKVIVDVDEYKADDIIEITGGESPSGHFDLTVEKVFAKNHRGYIDKEYVVPATDEEVAQAKRQAEKDEADRAIAAKFAEIGRAVGEFKAGDIVKVVRRTTGHYTGTIGEVVDDEETDYPLVRARYADGDVMDLYSWSEIITPVERRFDRD